MQYVIMKRVTLEAFQKGYSEELQPLFYDHAWIDHDGNMRHAWIACLGLAKTWETEEDAWNYVKAHWGLKFTFTNFLVVSVHDDALEQSAGDYEKIIYGKEAL